MGSYKERIKVLITGCGRHSYDIVTNLKNNVDRRPVEVYGINNNERNLLRRGIDCGLIAPSITDKTYITWLTSLCESEGIDIILPYITAELPILACNVDKFDAIGTKVSISSKDSLDVANDKIKLSHIFGGYMPRQAVVRSSDEIRTFAKECGYYLGKSLCCKLSNKCGGTGFAILDERKYLDINSFNKVGANRYISIDQLCEISDKVEVDLILQEYIAGKDYSVCVLADKGKILYACGFIGYAMEFGAVTSGEIAKNDVAYKIAEEVTDKLKLDGNACFDFILADDGNVKLLECNPRINASIPFIAEAGIDLVYMRCKQLLGEELPLNPHIEYGLKMAKSYESVYYK